MGQTRRQLQQREKEHLSHIRFERPEKSAVAAHVIDSLHPTAGISLLKEIGDWRLLDAYESIYIHKFRNTTLNQDNGPVPYSDLIKNLKF